MKQYIHDKPEYFLNHSESRVLFTTEALMQTASDKKKFPYLEHVVRGDGVVVVIPGFSLSSELASLERLNTRNLEINSSHPC